MPSYAYRPPTAALGLHENYSRSTALLASPQLYGERWGRRLDVVVYAYF